MPFHTQARCLSHWCIVIFQSSCKWESNIDKSQERRCQTARPDLPLERILPITMLVGFSFISVYPILLLKNVSPTGAIDVLRTLMAEIYSLLLFSMLLVGPFHNH
jgi:hypothetical protein